MRLNISFILILIYLGACSPKIITKTNTVFQKSDTVRKDSLIYVTTTIERIIKEDCKTKMEVRQENRTRRDSIYYVYKTIRDTIRLRGALIRDTVLIKEKTNRVQIRQENRTSRNAYFYWWLVIVAFFVGLFFKTIKNLVLKYALPKVL